MAYSDHGPLDAASLDIWLETACAPTTPPFGCWAVERAGHVLGYARLADATARTRAGDAELGVRLARAAWGEGVGTEAAMCLADVAGRSAHRLVAVVDPGNRRSVRLMEKLGMTLEREIMFPHYDHPDHLYVRA